MKTGRKSYGNAHSAYERIRSLYVEKPDAPNDQAKRLVRDYAQQHSLGSKQLQLFFKLNELLISSIEHRIKQLDNDSEEGFRRYFEYFCQKQRAYLDLQAQPADGEAGDAAEAAARSESEGSEVKSTT